MQTVIEKEVRYGFYERLKEEFPSQLLVDVAEYCNLACIHCPHSEFKNSEHYSSAKLDPSLNSKLIDEVSKYGKGHTQYIRYTSNGEPLIHPKIFEMLSYAVNNSDSLITLTTNGTILNENKIEQLLGTGIHVVDISIDAFKNETYSKIRINGNLDITRKNVLHLINESNKRGGNTKVVVSYVEMSQNMNETSDFEKFWNDNGANFVVIRRMHSCSGARNDLASERRKENKQFERRPCLYPWERMVLNPYGYLGYCPSDWVHGSQIIDYRKTTIYNTWHGGFYKKLREAHLNNDFKDFAFCGQCPDWISTRWPDEGRSYANMMQEFKDKE